MAGIPFFTESAEAARSWTRLVLAGENWPGITFVSGPGLQRNVEENSAKGEDGATLKDNGRKLAQFNIDTTIWTAEHWAEVQRLLPLIEPNRDGGPRSPIEVYHPILSLLGIDTIYIKQIQIPKYELRKTILQIHMSATRWAPAPKPVVKGVGRGTGPQCSKCDQIDATITNLQNMLGIALAAGDSAAVESLGNEINNQAAQKANCTCRQQEVIYDGDATYENLMAAQQLARELGDEAAVETLQNAIDNLNLPP